MIIIIAVIDGKGEKCLPYVLHFSRFFTADARNLSYLKEIGFDSSSPTGW
jgi:hypothetical protein